ncbi:Hypothetical protein A7982_11322 [Minicystis rosea]|nr:Hypothetical protein A7982_11322 [Minicystis rosea]
MSQRALKSTPLPHPPQADYLGPAQVTTATASAAEVELPSGDIVSARLALAFPYQPAPGDTLLVIGRGDTHYVIGVLDGTGATNLTLPGDVALRAAGALRLEGGSGVHMSGPEVNIDARRLRFTAEAMMQKLGSLVQRVTTLWSVRARDAEMLIEDASLTRARTAAILTDETMSINGKQINLG